MKQNIMNAEWQAITVIHSTAYQVKSPDSGVVSCSSPMHIYHGSIPTLSGSKDGVGGTSNRPLSKTLVFLALIGGREINCHILFVLKIVI